MTLRELVPWRLRSPFGADLESPFGTLQRDIDALLGDFARTNGGSAPGAGPRFLPPVNVSETDESIRISMELPGLDAKDVGVRLENGSLVLSGRKETDREEKGRTWLRRERTSGEFRRVVELPDGIDEAKVAATFTKGVLTVDVPRSREAQSRARAIEVRST